MFIYAETQNKGHDISSYQGKLTNTNIVRFRELGDTFFQVRFCQGVSFKDSKAEYNTKLLQDAGFLVGPYIFVTTDNALAQFDNFVESVKDFQFQLIPWLDYEYYSGSSQEKLETAKRLGIEEPEVKIITDFRYADAYFTSLISMVNKYALPSEAVLDSLAMKVANWMKSQPLMAYSAEPAVYTNAASGNNLKSPKWVKRPIAIAYWTETAPTPTLPNVWKKSGVPYYTWQKSVDDGTPYDIVGKIDRDWWGYQFPFPGTTPPPPPTGHQLKLELGKDIYSGNVMKEN